MSSGSPSGVKPNQVFQGVTTRRKSFKAGYWLHLVVRDAHTKNRLVGTETVVEEYEFAVGRPLKRIRSPSLPVQSTSDSQT